jgi:hypothetical protein
MTTKFTTPTINLNGTSAEGLYDEFSEARVKLTHALKGLRVLTVHPRDFQTTADGSWLQASTEYHEAMNRVDDALDWVDAWLVAIEEQMST